MNRSLCLLYLSSLAVAAFVSAQMAFAPSIDGGVIYDPNNWTNGLPSVDNPGSIMVDGSGSANQGHNWMRHSKVIVGGGATLTLGEDLGARGGVLTVNEATIHVADDIFSGNNGTLIFNANSSSFSADDFQAQAGSSERPSSIVIYGGKHSAGDDFGSQTGSNYLRMLGGEVTAAEFAFDGTGNVIGGTAVLKGLDELTTLSMDGSTNILSDWTGAWTIPSFSESDWRDALTSDGWTYDDIKIDGSLFDANFSVIDDGKTLSLQR